jgi:hypothetical protein
MGKAPTKGTKRRKEVDMPKYPRRAQEYVAALQCTDEEYEMECSYLICKTIMTTVLSFGSAPCMRRPKGCWAPWT